MCTIECVQYTNVYNRMCIVHNVVYCTHPIKLNPSYVYNTSFDWLLSDVASY